MAQIKFYGEREHLSRMRDRLSDVVHAVNQEVLGLPADKRFHRFLGLDREDFIHPSDRSPSYTIIEISMFEGRSAETKRSLLRGLMSELSEKLHYAPEDIEITIFETPKANWGIRGLCGDELSLSYKIEV